MNQFEQSHPNGFISSDEYEVGHVIDLRSRDANGNSFLPEVPHVIVSKKRYLMKPFGNGWRYGVRLLPENPMTEEDMEDIST